MPAANIIWRLSLWRQTGEEIKEHPVFGWGFGIQINYEVWKKELAWLKAIGGLWLIVGASGLLWGGVSLLRGAYGARAAALLGGVFGALLIFPWAQIATIGCAIFFLIAGWGLLGRHRWVQTVMVPAHLLLMVYTIVIWVAAFVGVGPSSPGWSRVPIVCSVSILANGGMALFMNSVGATEALSWLPLRTTPLIPLRCEYCGTPLDPRTNRCPECESVPEPASRQAHVPPEATLVSLTDGSRYTIKPGQATVIGRGSARNDINLTNPTVSRHHAQVVYEQGQYVLTALRDLNGTFINDALVRKRALEDGDTIRFGRARFRLEIMEIESRA